MLRIGVAFVALTGLGLFLASTPVVPYNVRELFARGGITAVLAFPVASAAVFAPPMLIAAWSSRGGWLRAIAAVGGVLAHAIAVWSVLLVGVPMESIHDVVGSAILGWPPLLEIMVRFVVLFATISALYVTGAHVAFALTELDRKRHIEALARWGACAASLLVTGHLVIVLGASTDNLTELMAGGGTIASSLWLGAAVVALATGTSTLAGSLRRRFRFRLAALILIAGWLVLWIGADRGTASAITKYSQTFSALQFLLSADREHYATPMELLVRGGIAYMLMVITGAVAQATLGVQRGSRADRHAKRETRRRAG